MVSYIIPLISLAWTSVFYKKALKKEKEVAGKVLSHSKTKVIGITGSYGKTSTKNLIYQIISKHYKTVETPKSYNTIFGVIRTINSSIKKNTEFFICEMGAYKKNEIKQLTQIVPPDIAIITGISPQHLALFGSIENLIKTKYEIVESLKSKRSPVFINITNSSTKPILKLTKKEHRSVFTYSLNSKKQADYSIKIISQKKLTTKIMFTTPQKKYFYTTNLQIIHFIENLTVALSVAHYLKIPNQKIKSVLKNIDLPSEAFHFKKLSPRLILIDDSYNSNPQGFIAAIKELRKLPPRFKMVVTSGIVELGREERVVHQKIGDQLKSADLILLTTPDFAKDLKIGLDKHQHKLKTVNYKNITSILNNNLKYPASILIEGRIPASIKKIILNLK